MQCEFHGFANVSNVAYAATVYLVTSVTSVSGDLTTSLLISKSRVAPVKCLSVPRLELSAAVLLFRLMDFTRNATTRIMGVERSKSSKIHNSSMCYLHSRKGNNLHPTYGEFGSGACFSSVPCVSSLRAWLHGSGAHKSSVKLTLDFYKSPSFL